MAYSGIWNSTDVGWGYRSTSVSAGLKERVSDVITMVSTKDTPTMAVLGKEAAPGLYFEWFIENLAAISTAGATEGEEVTAGATLTGRRKLSNFVQHFQTSFALSLDNLELSKRGATYGVSDEFKHQAMKKMLETQKNINSRFWSLPATSGAAREDGPSSASTPLFGNFHYWASQTSAVVTADGRTSAQWITQGYTSITTATLYALSEAMYANAMDPDTLFCSPGIKIDLDRAFINDSGLQYNVRNTGAVEGNTYAPIVDIIKTSLTSRVAVIVDRAIPQTSTTATSAASDVQLREAWYLAERNRMKVCWWRELKEYPLPPTGDNIRGYIRGGCSVKIDNPNAIGGAYAVVS